MLLQQLHVSIEQCTTFLMYLVLGNLLNTMTTDSTITKANVIISLLAIIRRGRAGEMSNDGCVPLFDMSRDLLRLRSGGCTCNYRIGYEPSYIEIEQRIHFTLMYAVRQTPMNTLHRTRKYAVITLYSVQCIPYTYVRCTMYTVFI